MEEDQESKHVCRFCRKSFPCGRSLGGHMRSHIASNNSAETEEKLAARKLKLKNPNMENGEAGTNTGYDLREKRKKTWRVADSSDDTLISNKFCKQCGKGFHSWKALFGHMKCHSERERASINGDILDDQDSWATVDSQSDNEAPNRRRRSKRTRTTTSSLSFPNPSSSVSEIEQEQEEVAMSLMMLSRDMGPWGFQEMGSEKKAKRSELSASDQSPGSWFTMNKTKKLDVQSAMEDSEEADDEQGKKYYKFLGSELNSNPSKNSDKRGKFECTTCNKIFHSYQALGGHRASHKKITRGCFASIEESNENTIETGVSHREVVSGFDLHEEAESKKKNSHECPICLRIFLSGQALGGHKRSHLAGGSESQKDQSTVQEIRDLIDLNLPASDAAEEESNNNSHSESCGSPWWVRGSHKREAMVGLMSN